MGLLAAKESWAEDVAAGMEAYSAVRKKHCRDKGMQSRWRCVRPVFRSRKTGVFYLSVLFHFPFSFAFAVQFPVTTDIELLTL